MPERIERYSFIFAALVQIFAVGWWISALNENVTRQDKLTTRLESELRTINSRLIRLEVYMEKNDNIQ